MKTPTMAITTPMVETISGKIRPSWPNAAWPRIRAATRVTAYDSKRSAAMPAQSPTLSPTLSAIVAGFRVILGDALLDLADQVGADVGGLGEDAAADPHEHGEQRRAEAEALEDAGRLLDEDQHDDRGAEQAEPDRRHADHATGAERDLGALVAPAGLVRRG